MAIAILFELSNAMGRTFQQKREVAGYNTKTNAQQTYKKLST
jgi:hypothetical protein